MSGLRDLAKGGWHPKGKESGKESWRGDFKGVNTVAGWVGKGKTSSEAALEHQSTPLSSLKDPASFGPPPKRILHPAPAASSSSATGEPAAQDDISTRPQPPASQSEQTTAVGKRPDKPKLPPRLPPRQNSRPDAYAQAPPPPYSETAEDNASSQGILNQGAMERLGKAGVSVPGFDIGTRHPSPPVPPRRITTPSSPAPAHASPSVAGGYGAQTDELNAKFAKMSNSPTQSQGSSTGTSWADKQAALKTASNIRSDPAKVQMSDLTKAAATANNFRQRHGEQAAAGWRATSGLHQKYASANKSNNYDSTPPLSPQSPTKFSQSGLGKKPPPPPPPPKKKELSSNPGEPPPIPIGSKPKF